MSREEINKAIYGMDKRKSKYGVDTSEKGKEDRTYDGIVFDSVHEMKAYRDWVKPNVNIGLFHDLRFQVKFDLHVPTPNGFRVKVGTYVADWTALDRENRLNVIEAKGHQTPLYKRNKRHFEAQYGLRIIEL